MPSAPPWLLRSCFRSSIPLLTKGTDDPRIVVDLSPHFVAATRALWMHHLSGTDALFGYGHPLGERFPPNEFAQYISSECLGSGIHRINQRASRRGAIAPIRSYISESLRMRHRFLQLPAPGASTAQVGFTCRPLAVAERLVALRLGPPNQLNLAILVAGDLSPRDGILPRLGGVRVDMSRASEGGFGYPLDGLNRALGHGLDYRGLLSGRAGPFCCEINPRLYFAPMLGSICRSKGNQGGCLDYFHSATCSSQKSRIASATMLFVCSTGSETLTFFISTLRCG